MQTGVHAPDWLAAGWERYWNGKTFDVCLCTEKIPSVSTAAVWNTVLAVSFGETLSYGEVAVRSGIPGGARAVGAIMRANPWALFLPCHRVIGKDGSMRGYGGSSGVTLKRKLIEYERKLMDERKGGP
jgi:methylated-DNA-[protein]-cysteine S-methyltransferase